jgi:hypothetical protein
VFHRPRLPQALALLGLAGAACAVTLAACGGGDKGTTESTMAGGTTTSGAIAQEGSRQAGNGSAGHRTSGSGNSASFKVPGGDNGIQEFGKEVAGSDLRQANEAVAALFRAVKSGDWSEVCGQYLSRQNVEAFKKLAEMSPHIEGASCPEVLGRLNSASENPTAPKNGVGAIRVEGDLGFGLYRGTDGKGYAISMKKEDGRWKLNALRPTSLEP